MIRVRFWVWQLTKWVIPSVAILAMFARILTSWGPMNLTVLVGFTLVSASLVSCIPITPKRTFWVGLACFGVSYALLVVGMARIAGNLTTLPMNEVFQRMAESHYERLTAPPRDFLEWVSLNEQNEKIALFVIACHALTALAVGILGGFLLLHLARRRELREWNRIPLPSHSYAEFNRSPLIVDHSPNSQ